MRQGHSLCHVQYRHVVDSHGIGVRGKQRKPQALLDIVVPCGGNCSSQLRSVPYSTRDTVRLLISIACTRTYNAMRSTLCCHSSASRTVSLSLPSSTRCCANDPRRPGLFFRNRLSSALGKKLQNQRHPRSRGRLPPRQSSRIARSGQPFTEPHQKSVPVGSHLHLDAHNCLEEGLVESILIRD